VSPFYKGDISRECAGLDDEEFDVKIVIKDNEIG
jgi:hypothetical protein